MAKKVRKNKVTQPPASENLSFFEFLRTKRWTSVSLIVALVLALVATVGVIASDRVLNSNILVDSGNNTESDDGVLDEELATKPGEKEQYMNILLCGIDYKENTARGKLTDVMMVIHMDFVDQTVDILQLPRDTYIGRDYSTGKLNAVYSSSHNGGIENLARKINSMLQLPLDYYVVMNMDGFEDIVDLIGGVTVDSPYSFTLEGVTIVKGVQTLNGRAANKFVRERHAYAAGDLTRMKMQQIFFKAFVKKCLSLDKTEMLKLAPTIFQYLNTDMSINDALSYYQLFAGMDMSALEFHSCEVTSFKDRYDGLSKLSIHVKPLADLLNEHFRENGEKVNWVDLQIIEAATSYAYEGEQDQYVQTNPALIYNQNGSSNNSTVSRPSSSSTVESTQETSSTTESSSEETSSEVTSEVISEVESEVLPPVSSEVSETTSDVTVESSSDVSSETSSAPESSNEQEVWDDPEKLKWDETTSALE